MRKLPVEQWGAERQRNREKFESLVTEVGAFEKSILHEPVVPMALAILVGQFAQDDYATFIEPIVWSFSVGTDFYCQTLHQEAQSKRLELENVRIRGFGFQQMVHHQDQLIKRRMSNTRALAILEVFSVSLLNFFPDIIYTENTV